MSVNYATSVKNTRLNAVRDAIDAGAAAGHLKIFTAGYATLLSDHVCTDPCASGASGGVLTFSAIGADTSANATGTAALGRFEDSDGNVVADNLSVGTSGTDIIINSINITAGDNVSVTSATITHG